MASLSVHANQRANPVVPNVARCLRYDVVMVTGALLAGGQARRFDGRDKSALVLDGRSLLETLVARLTDITDDVLVVSRRHSHTNVVTPARLVEDRAPGCGPLGGLDTAMAYAHHDAVVIVACDMPYVTARLMAHLAILIQPPGPMRRPIDAVVPRTERGYHPLCAAYHRSCHETVIRRLAERHLEMSGLLQELVVRDLCRNELSEFGDPDRLLTNVNTVQDYDALLRHRL